MKLQPIFFLTCLFCLIKPFSSSLAQSQTLQEALVEMFGPLDKNRVHTGYLLDQSPDYVNMSLYDGTALVDSIYDQVIYIITSFCYKYIFQNNRWPWAGIWVKKRSSYSGYPVFTAGQL
jgi:hypothetical protein